mmetsp:Transcript_38929/g.64657  ORF Transcript_38929/g.64657 Transcript_38929/m.64657 type:complete len:83 (-) Transcript_38929:93-341(-)
MRSVRQMQRSKSHSPQWHPHQAKLCTRENPKPSRARKYVQQQSDEHCSIPFKNVQPVAYFSCLDISAARLAQELVSCVNVRH